MNIRLSKSSIGNEEIVAVSDVLKKEYLGMGEQVKYFEDEIKNFLDSTMDVVCVNSGTAALHLALAALKLKPGDEVLVPSLTYVASFQAISACNLVPVSCEVDSETLFIDHNDAKKKITKRTKAIMPVHHSSSSNGIKNIYKLAEAYNLRVVEDAAQAFGSRNNNQMVGFKGDIICFSFDGIKNITCGEGGAVLSSDKGIISFVQDARLLGVVKDTERRFSGQRSWDFEVFDQGFRYHMSNIMAAIGRIQLKRIGDFTSRRRFLALNYIRLLKDVNDITFFKLNYSEILPHIFVIKTNKRDDLRQFLLENNIEVGIHYKPNHLLKKYRSNEPLLITEKIYQQILTLPLHYDLKDSEQLYVTDKIIEFFNL